eukprot:10431303-Lingulodinium_polyedra.AAC.1
MQPLTSHHQVKLPPEATGQWMLACSLFLKVSMMRNLPSCPWQARARGLHNLLCPASHGSAKPAHG